MASDTHTEAHILEELNRVISEATANIEAGYMLLNIHGGPAVYRERVYCYELYHQMRRRWPERCKYVLNGEVDKAAHPILAERGLGRVKPDLLVHGPGHMDLNYAAIEVKSGLASAREIKKDIATLSEMAYRAGYRRGIYLIYGGDADQSFIDRVMRISRGFEELPRIEIWIHPRARDPAACVTVIGNSPRTE